MQRSKSLRAARRLVHLIWVTCHSHLPLSRSKGKGLAVFWLMYVSSFLFAQDPKPGDLDVSFQLFPAGQIYSVDFQPDGKMLVVGAFANLNGVAANSAARLNPDGSIDPSFNIGTGPVLSPGWSRGPEFWDVKALPDGTIFLAGLFEQVNGVSVKHLARVSTNGTVDPAFQIPPDKVIGISQILAQSDGKVYVDGGLYHGSSGGPPVLAIYLLNMDGSIDPSFDVRSQPNPFLARQSSGKAVTVLGDDFNRRLARLNPDGSEDPTFSSALSFRAYSPVPVVADKNDKILTHSNGVVFRLNPNGDPDAAFAAPRTDGDVSFIKRVSDGKYIIAGTFTQVNGVARKSIARLYGDRLGSPPSILAPPRDQASYAGQTVRFEVGESSVSPAHFQWQYQGADLPGATNRALVLSNIQTSQTGEYRVIVSNEFGSATSETAHLTVFSAAAGALDLNFRAGKSLDGAVNAILKQNGKLVIGGSFTNVDGLQRQGVARLLADGGLDADFHAGGGISGLTNPAVNVIEAQSDGRLVIGGQFDAVSGSPRHSIARLNADGSLDEGFHPDPGTNRLVKSIAFQSNGQILVGGDFSYLGGDRSAPFQNLVRLNADGGLDQSYSPNPLAIESHHVFYRDLSVINSIEILPADRALVAGGISTIAGRSASGVARLDSAGASDTNFIPDLDYNIVENVVSDMVVQPDGSILISGSFAYPQQFPVARIDFRLGRLMPEGSRDTNFQSLAWNDVEGSISALALQPDGRVLIGGKFASVRGMPRKNIARLNGDGSVDALFDAGPGPDGEVKTIALLPDGSIIVGGDFKHFNGVERHGLARLTGEPGGALALFGAKAGVNGFSFSWQTVGGGNYVVERAELLSGAAWTQAGNVAGDGSIKTFSAILTSGGQAYYRVRVIPR